MRNRKALELKMISAVHNGLLSLFSLVVFCGQAYETALAVNVGCHPSAVRDGDSLTHHVCGRDWECTGSSAGKTRVQPADRSSSGASELAHMPDLVLCRRPPHGISTREAPSRGSAVQGVSVLPEQILRIPGHCAAGSDQGRFPLIRDRLRNASLTEYGAQKPVIFLHAYHHAIVPISAWVTFRGWYMPLV